MNKVTLILTYQCNYWFVCKTIILKSEKCNLVLKEIKLKVSLIYLETAKTRKNKIEQSSAPVPPSFPKLADSISFNCAFEPDAEDTAVEGHAPEMERNKEKRTQGEMLCFKTCASWLQWKEMALPDDDRRWQIGVRARGARATGVVFGGAKWALVRRVEKAAAELVVEQQPTRQLKLKLMKSTGTCVPKTARGKKRKKWMKWMKPSHCQRKEEKKLDPCVLEERQQIKLPQWTRAVWLTVCGGGVCAWPLPSGTTGRRGAHTNLGWRKLAICMHAGKEWCWWWLAAPRTASKASSCESNMHIRCLQTTGSSFALAPA